ncbi:peptidoglycan DD-metalloendopeptidase family protein [Bacillus sp. USDA818B3_A]|uniref:peptidoglycan DD-metalloendopeptidase family protein n=1 Tax=Bacillus sp. USDA818B3_A TaxID=2698834 RepID=UPI001F295D05|nr:peptidoglycan DD-metalloendopeptidase family protein [Bacillus sp. USDA818B3_A]
MVWKRGKDKEDKLVMRDYIKRFLIAIIMALCVSLLFLGGKHSEAAGTDTVERLNDRWMWPADGIISDTYGTREGRHKGIDIAGRIDTPILAVEDGIVEKSYYSNTYGNVVFIKHPSHFVTVYAHLNKRNVSKGQSIQQGDVIGRMGRTGQATGTHLHFETHQLEWRYDKKNALDPEKLLGNAEVGNSVQAGIASSVDLVLAASSQLHTQQHETTNSPGILNKYVVKQGDTLSSIAQRLDATVQEVKKVNQLTSDLIRPNQILIIP